MAVDMSPGSSGVVIPLPNLMRRRGGYTPPGLKWSDAAAAGGGHPPPADAAAAGGGRPPRLMRRRAPAGGIHFENYVFKGFVCSYFSEKTGFPKTIPFGLPKIKVLLPK